AWKRNLFVACALVLIAGAAQRLRFFPLFLAGVACIVLGFVSEASVFNDVLPQPARFDYPRVQPLSFLRNSGERRTPMAAHLLQPKTCAVYGVSDLRVHNPLFPRRYLTFMRAAGASVDAFNQTFERSLSSLLDVAAVRYVLSLLPVRFERDGVAVYTRPDAVAEDGISFGPDIHLNSVVMSYQSEHAEVCGRLEFEARLQERRRYSYSLAWLDDKGNVVWFGDQNYFSREPLRRAAAVDAPLKLAREFAVPVSLATKPGGKL